MSYALPAEALHWRSKIRAFVDSELRPLELQAEMNEGRIPPEARKRHEKFAIDAGITLMDTPKELGGLALPLLTQVMTASARSRDRTRTASPQPSPPSSQPPAA